MAEWERRGGVNKKRKAVLCDARARVRSAEGEKMEAGGEMFFSAGNCGAERVLLRPTVTSGASIPIIRGRVGISF